MGHYPLEVLVSLRRLLSAYVNAERAHPPVKMTAVDPHQFGGARHIAFGLVQFSLNELTMIGVAGFLERRKAVGRGRWFCAAERRQILYSHSMIGMHDYDPLDCVPQFAHVAGP